MTSLRNKLLLIGLFTAVLILGVASVALAAPVIPKGVGIPNAFHSTYPGYCLGCHTGFAVAPPAIKSGATATHGFRGGTCSQCHKIVTPPPPPRVPVTILKGASRYDTAIAVSKAAYPTGAPTVVLATGAKFPDALCAAPLAKAFGGPILLVRPGAAMDAALLAEVKRLHPSTVIIIGSGAVVSGGVESQARGLSWAPSVTRLAGANRFQTSAAVADALKVKLGIVGSLVVANGRKYADALAAAPLAASKGWPILLTEPSALPTDTSAAVARMGATSSLIVGGTSVVGTAVEAALPSPVRKGGTDRYVTSALVADYAASLGMSYGTLVTTVGTNYPDALAAGPLVAQKNGILLLTLPSGVPASIAARMSANKAGVKSLVVIGGAVPQNTIDTMSTLLN